jgi:cytochrome c
MKGTKSYLVSGKVDICLRKIKQNKPNQVKKLTNHLSVAFSLDLAAFLSQATSTQDTNHTSH